MDEELDPCDENVNFILAQEYSQLLHILGKQTPKVIMELCQMMPTGSRNNIDHLTSTNTSVTEHIKALLEYFMTAKAVDCCNFLQSLCFLCEDMPMHLETKLISVAGYTNTDAIQSATTETVPLQDTNYWPQYINEVMSLMQKRWERRSEHLVREVQLEKVWVSLRLSNRGRDRPDQTPGSVGSKTPEPDADFGSFESRLTLEAFLQGCAGKVTILFGRTGSGKTLLMSCLGQQWAQGLGPFPSSYLFILLEFRQLNLLSQPLSLSDLLFRHYLSPTGGEVEKRAIMDYLLSNPEQSCWVLDGYDEFHSKLTKEELPRVLPNAEKPLPVADLISGLLNRQLLPGCTVLVTCRHRDITDFEGIADKVGQLLEWDRNEIKEHVNSFFGLTGDSASRASGVQAAELLLSSQHLLAMSSLPALCNICCICLKHLLLKSKEEGTQVHSGNKDQETVRPMREKATEDKLKRAQVAGERRAWGEELSVDGTKDRAKLPPATAKLPSTITQVYLSVLNVFLGCDPYKGGKTNMAEREKHPQSAVCGLESLTHYRSELCELTRLAWRGLDESKILFTEKDLSQDVLEFAVRTGLLLQVELRGEDGMPVKAYSFIHLTMQEFLAALRIMTSNDVNDMHLKNRFSLKTRWTTKTDQRTVFTDSLPLYVCGLASSHCTSTLVQIARVSNGTAAQSWVQKRQGLVMKLLKKLCHSTTLTGPKILELCRCVQESQDHQLAKHVVGTRPTLELRNIRLLPNDIDALAFVVNSVHDIGIGLDFGACSMEMECLDALLKCCSIHYLSFRSRKYGDKFAERLSLILPEFKNLRKLEFCGASLTSMGADSLASALQTCTNISQINLSDNNLKDDGIKYIAGLFNKLPRLASVMLGRNNSSLKALDYLIGKMTSCLNIQHIHADGIREVTVKFSENSDVNSHKNMSEPTISLLNEKWSTPEMQNLAKALVQCPPLSVLDLSGGQWDVDVLRTLAEFLPKLKITKEIILNDSCSSVEGLVVLTALLSKCPSVVELHVRLESSQAPKLVSIVFSEGRQKPANELSRTLCLSYCDLVPADLDKVWRSLGASSDLTALDLSSNCLGNKGLRKLLDVLPRLQNVQEINVSNNGISMEGVLILAEALCSYNNLTQIHISDGGRELVLLKFCYDKSNQQLKIFRLNKSSLQPSDITTLCKKLVKCPNHLELDLSDSSFTDHVTKNLLKLLPKMLSLQRLNVSNCITSTIGAMTLVSSLIVSQRVTSVDLRFQSESFICFDSVKAEQVSCRLTNFSLNSHNLEELIIILQQAPEMTVLDLSSNHLDDEGVKHLVHFLPRIKITRYINLSRNNLTQQGILAVASSVLTSDVSGVEVSLGAENRCLIWFRQHGGCEKMLSVQETSLKSEYLLGLAEIVSNSSCLTKLVLKDNLLQSENIEDFVKALNIGPNVLSISIEEGWIRAEKAVYLVCGCLELCDNIQTIRVHQTTIHLRLMRSTEVTAASADSADPILSTKEIGLVDCGVHGHQLAPMRRILQRCPLLKELDLSDGNLGIEGAEFLCSVLPLLPNLTSLSIAAKETVTDALEKVSQVLLHSTSIQNINLSGHVIQDTTALAIIRMFPRLRSLSLYSCDWSATERLLLIQALGQCVSLESLGLDLNEDSSLCLGQALRKIKSLRSLKLNKIPTVMGPSEVNSVQDLLTDMEGLTQMEEIELEGWRMADRGAEQLTRLLHIWTKLRKISLSKNVISDQSGDKLVEALINCTHLEELNLSSNSVGDLTAARMALVLPSLPHISVLDISENRIGDKGSESLSKAIMYMKNLARINLTSVGTSELCAVAASLAHCPLIQDVGMGWNNCGDKVAVELAKVLPLCQNMTRLDLESNGVSVLGVEALGKALKSCPALRLIRLWRNKVSPIDAQRLSEKDGRLNFSFT
uniref:NOD-like receptor family CARD domain containing 5 n=1 Tax=Channa punctata TaxID=304456 RepID=A0A514C9A5_CHAPF|nr:NOD-like receptor family CARD domain containing 5 [Channa punctata]